MTKKKFRNPFYPLLIITGILFLVTVSAYSLMAFNEVYSSSAASGLFGSTSLNQFLKEHGMVIMAWLLGLIGVFTVGVIAGDSMFDKPVDEFVPRRKTLAEKLQASSDTPAPLNSTPVENVPAKKRTSLEDKKVTAQNATPKEPPH